MSWLSTARPRARPSLSIVLLLLVTAAQLLAANLYECAVGCDDIPVVSTSSAAGDDGPAGVSTAAVALAVTALQAAGVQVTGSFGSQLSLQLSDEQLRSQAVQQHCCYVVESEPQVLPRRAAAKPAQSSRLGTEQGRRAMMVDKLLAAYPGLNGTGVKVGLLSDSYWETPVESGKQPSPCAAVNNATILRDFKPSANSSLRGFGEGRAMAELICFTAPGVQFVFRTGFLGEADMASGILELAAAGCNVIVDDLYYFNEGEYSVGVITQAVEQVAAQGVSYFGAAGNYDGAVWEASSARWTTFGNRTLHNFGNKAAPNAFLEVYMYGRARFYLHWNEPFFRYTNGRVGAWSDIDFFMCPTPELTSSCFNNRTDNNGNETSPIGKDPWELLDVPVTTSGPMYLAIELVDTQQPNKRNAGAAAAGAAAADAQASAGAAAVAEVAGGVEGGASVADAVVLPRVAMRLKLRWNNTGNVEIVEGQADNTAEAPSIIPHVNTPACIATAAAQYDLTPGYGFPNAVMEDYSSKGRTPIFFDAQGNRFPGARLYSKPDVTGPDGLDTSFFPPEEREFSDYDDTGFPNFYGTSAAAPAVAAVAALMLQNNRSLTPAEVYSRLRASAIDIGRPGYDPKSGFGFVAANRIKLEGCPGALNGTRCNTGSLCSLNGTCTEGVCVGQPKTCPGATSCRGPGICSPATGQCINAIKPNGTACPPVRHIARRPCSSVQWQCQAGTCAAVRIPEQQGTRCTDGDRCTVRDRCDGKGSCIGERVCRP